MVDCRAEIAGNLRPKRFNLTVLRIDNSPIQVSADTLTELLKKLLLELKTARMDADTLFQQVAEEAGEVSFTYVKDD
jgi:hypothetical protein